MNTMFQRGTKPSCTPGRVVDQGLRLVLGEIVRLKLLTGGDAGPSLFSGSTCWKYRDVTEAQATNVTKSVLEQSQEAKARRDSSGVLSPRMRNMRCSSSSTVEPGNRGLPVIIS